MWKRIWSWLVDREFERVRRELKETQLKLDRAVNRLEAVEFFLNRQEQAKAMKEASKQFKREFEGWPPFQSGVTGVMQHLATKQFRDC